MKDLDNKMAFSKMKYCPDCGIKMIYKHAGIYECPQCGKMDKDDFCKVKTFLDENGPTPAAIVSQETGVPMITINEFLRLGKVEIPENSEVFIKCEMCGTDIRYGRYCPECIKSLSKKIRGALAEDVVGEKPRRKRIGDQDNNKMFFLDKRR